ncbi:MAG: MMPL family transporter [Planctomycetaceae bacterium]
MNLSQLLSSFYLRHSKHLLLAAAMMLPYFAFEVSRMPANNNVETWLPDNSAVRADYDDFLSRFGGDETILIGIPDVAEDSPLLESVACRLEGLSEIRRCWSPARLKHEMEGFSVPADEARARLDGLVLSPQGRMVGMLAQLSPAGVADRDATVTAIRRALDYCQLDADNVYLAGAAVTISELDHLGGFRQNTFFFCVTLLVSSVILWLVIRDIHMTTGVMLVTVWAVGLSESAVSWMGGEFNFIMSAMPVMVMVFTLAISIHYLHYYRASVKEPNAIGLAIRRAFRPCFWATLTTVIGLCSLTVSEFSPVRQFGLGAAFGAFTALFAGLGLTPALVCLMPKSATSERDEREWLPMVGFWIMGRTTRIVLGSLVLVAASAYGIMQLQSSIDPLEFLPKGSLVARDIRVIEADLTPYESIEVTVDFGTEDIPLFEKIDRVRKVETQIAAHPNIRHTLSQASFFPTELPESRAETMRLLSRAGHSQDNRDFVSVGQRFWRISARVVGDGPSQKHATADELQKMVTGENLTITGIAPLLAVAQQDIFRGFWSSFAAAFAIITFVMMLSLRSITLSIIAMIPNLVPIAIVFGIMGWCNIPVDIGMMMTASIALGIAVDGTFHFVTEYRHQIKRHRNRERASRNALWRTGAPIFQAALIASLGMLALAASQFVPTARFGLLMSTLLMAAVVGDLLLLPSLLAFGHKSRQKVQSSTQTPTANRHYESPIRAQKSRSTAPEESFRRAA